MSRSLIRKNQLHPDIADLVGKYGSGFFITDEEVVYISGNQTISGVKTFATEIFAPNLVYNTGNQTISGVKTFATRPTVNGTEILLSGDLNQNLYSNYFPYLGAWFTTNSAFPHGLHIAASKNGYDWNILTSRPNSGGGTVNTNQLRDPSIVRLDNKWAIAFTENSFASDPYNRSSDNSGFFGILQSTNLAEWSYSRVSLSGLLSNIGVTDYNRLWAPEWFKEDNGDLYLTFSINRTGWGNHNRGHMVYIVQATNYNLTGWTNLRRMSGSAFPFFPPNSTDISSGIYDMCIEKTGNIYYGAYWDERNVETRLASSTNLFTGWNVIASGKSWYGNNFPTYTSFNDGSYKEGGCIRYFDGKWRLWVTDVLGEKSGIYSEGLTPTGMSFVSLTNAGNYRLEHGTIIKSNDIANMIYYSGLVNQYNNQTISGIKNFSIRPTVNGTGVLLSGQSPAISDSLVTHIRPSGTNNVFVSSTALASTSTNSQNNIAVGVNALTANTVGDDNVAMGHQALSSNTNGNGNIGIGRDALKNANGPDANICIGTQAGDTIQAGGSNIIIGHEADVDNDGRQRCIVLGRSATSPAIDGSLAIGGTAGNAMANLNVATAGAAAAGEYLNIYINGVQRKIALLLP